MSDSESPAAETQSLVAEPQTSYDATAAVPDVEAGEPPAFDEEAGPAEEGPSDEPEKPKEKIPYYGEAIVPDNDLYNNLKALKAGLLYGRVVWYNDFRKDLWFLIKNTHVTLGCFLAHRLDEFDRSERLVYLFCVLMAQYPVSHYVAVNYVNAPAYEYYGALIAGSALMQVYEAFIKFLATCPCMVVNGCCEKKCKYQDGACFCDCECMCCPRPAEMQTGHEHKVQYCGVCNMCSCWPCGCIKSGLDADIADLMEFNPDKHSGTIPASCGTHCCHSRYILNTLTWFLEAVGSLGMGVCLIFSFTLFFLAMFDEKESPLTECNAYFTGILLTWGEAFGITFGLFIFTKYTVDDLIHDDPSEHIDLNYDAYGGQGPEYPTPEFIIMADYDDTGVGMFTLCGCGDDDDDLDLGDDKSIIEWLRHKEDPEYKSPGEEAAETKEEAAEPNEEAGETPAEDTPVVQQEPAAEPEEAAVEPPAEPPAEE